MQSKTGGAHALGVAATLGVVALLSVIGVLWPAQKPSWTTSTAARVDCQADRRTVRHAGGVVLGTGNYEPCLIDTGMTTGETGLAISRDGTLLRSAATRPLGIAVSSDNGRSWQRRLLPVGATVGIADGYLDPVTDRYFYSAMGATPVYASGDHGATWKTGVFDSPKRMDWNRVFSGVPVSPRAVGYPTNIYYCNWTTPGGFNSFTRCYKSVDGGRVFRTTGSFPYTPEDCTDPTQTPGVGHGRGIVDPRDGAIYMPVKFCGALELAVSRDEGETWTRHVIARLKGAGYGGILDAIRSRAWGQQLASGRMNVVPAEMAYGQGSDALGMDGAGRLYAVWINQHTQPVLSWSSDQGQTWSTPVPFGAPGLMHAILPAIAVMPEGRVGVSYYGSADRGATWTGYLAISDDATTAAPTFDTAPITRAGEPLMPEPCCWASGPQEYTIARWSPDGSLWGAFAATRPSGDAEGVLGHLVRP